MGFNFPDVPTVGQVHLGYVWDGEKWQTQGAATHGAVRYDIAQGLSATQQVQGRSNIYAAPFDALAYSGMQINGSMEVSQEKAATPTTVSAHICDSWFLVATNITAAVAAQITMSPTFFPGFSNLMYITVGTAQPSLGAISAVNIHQAIEGYRISKLAWGMAGAQPITIGFWTAHARAGIYGGSIRNGAADRSYAFSYTQNVADAREYKTITVPGCTDGVWNVGNGIGLYLAFSMAVGTDYIAPSANTWLTGNYLTAPGQINGVAATSDVFRITGVIVLPGIEAPSAARSALIMRPYSQELITCQRYFRQFKPGASNSALAAGVFFSTGLVVSHMTYPEMRAAPTMSYSALGDFQALGGGGIMTATVLALTGTTTTSARLDLSGVGGTAGQGALIQSATANAILKLDARL